MIWISVALIAGGFVAAGVLIGLLWRRSSPPHAPSESPGPHTQAGPEFDPLDLPLIDDPTMDAPQVPEMLRSPAAGAHSVVLVDDDEFILDLVREILEPVDLQVECLATGAELRARMASDLPPPDVLILDLSLPDAFGENLLDDACQAWEDTIRILCTGHISDELDTHFAGRASAILRKPFEPSEVLELFGHQLLE